MGAEDAGVRLDKVLAARGGISRGRARRALESGGVFVDDRRVRVASRPVRPGQRIRVVLEETGESGGSGTRSLSAHALLHRDAGRVFVDKPPGIPSQATQSSVHGALPELVADALGGAEVFPVHRLDRETSGVMVFALDADAAAEVSAAFRAGTVEKVYLALTLGAPDAPSGRTALALARDPDHRGRWRAVQRGGVPAQTGWEVLARFGESARPGGFSLLRLRPTTGRTHQLRAHLEALGHPILGDRRYGGAVVTTLDDGTRIEPERCLLHAASLALPDPGSEAVRAPIPEDFRAVALGLGCPRDALDTAV